MDQSQQWDLDALWDTVGRATAAAAWRAPGMESKVGPGYWSVTTDLNVWGGNFLALYGRGPAHAESMRSGLEHCLQHGKETAAFVHPRIFPQVLPMIEGRPVHRGGIVPVMARIGTPEPTLRRPHATPVTRLGPTSDSGPALAAVADAFEMDVGLAQEALGGAVAHPEIAFHVAGMEVTEAVCISHLLDGTCYIDIMAAPKAGQRRGAGRAVICAAMDDAARTGANRFFLLSSQAGQPLYQSLGFEMVDVAQFWLINGPPEEAAASA